MNIYYAPISNGAETQTPRRIIVHAMAEKVQFNGRYISALELLIHTGLSAHALVHPNGAVTRCRSDHQGAYHAKGYNDNSLGIEYLVQGAYSYEQFIQRIRAPYLNDAQYAAGKKIISAWVTAYGIKDIKRHSDLDPTRKQDPGDGFPWQRLVEELYH